MAANTTGPALLKGLRRASRLMYGHREVKMLGPKCDICQAGDQVPPRWWEDCTHEPYIGVRGETITTRKYEDELGPDGEPTGSRIVTGTEQTVVERPWPNFRQVSLTTRINSGQGVEKARAKGFIMPSELRSEAFPEGIADCCEFKNCFWQQDLRDYPTGRFCRPLEAAYAYEDVRGTTVEVFNMDRRQGQIDEAMVRVR